MIPLGYIKICGVRDAETARGIAALGASAIGINLWQKSPRAVTIEQAGHIAQAVEGLCARVAVLVDPSVEELAIVRAQVQPDWIQVHGMCAPAPDLYFAIGLQDEHDVASAVNALGLYVLVDAKDDVRRGGTGRLAPFELARGVSQQRPVILAGGLNATNVGAAIRAVRPRGVDVASGVEAPDGTKDLAKIGDFIAAARRAFEERS